MLISQLYLMKALISIAFIGSVIFKAFLNFSSPSYLVFDWLNPHNRQNLLWWLYIKLVVLDFYQDSLMLQLAQSSCITNLVLQLLLFLHFLIDHHAFCFIHFKYLVIKSFSINKPAFASLSTKIYYDKLANVICRYWSTYNPHIT